MAGQKGEQNLCPRRPPPACPARPSVGWTVGCNSDQHRISQETNSAVTSSPLPSRPLALPLAPSVPLSRYLLSAAYRDGNVRQRRHLYELAAVMYFQI